MMLKLKIEKVAHGGVFVARHEGRVIFVSGAIDGEVVDVEVTEDAGKFLRATVTNVVEASEHRQPHFWKAAREGAGGAEFGHIALSHQRELKAQVLEEALQRFGAPQIFNTDQGSQFTSGDFTGVLNKRGVLPSMDGRGRFVDNIFIERFWRSLKYEEVYLRAYDTVADAKRWIYRYIDRYNSIRPHASLGGKTPDKIHSLAPAEGLLKAS